MRQIIKSLVSVCLSVSLSVNTLTAAILIRFLPFSSFDSYHPYIAL